MHTYLLITGGSGGIGSEIAKILPSVGMRPIVAYRNNKEKAERIAKETGGFSIFLDLDDDFSIKAALDEIRLKMGEKGILDGVVLCAANPPDLVPFGKIQSESMLKQLRTNVIGPQQLVAGLIKYFMRANKKGIVVGILSEAIARDERPAATGMGSYIIAKTAMRGMLDVCAAEYQWLKVKEFSPGFTQTDMLNVFDPRYLELVAKNSKISSAKEVAEKIVKEIVK